MSFLSGGEPEIQKWPFVQNNFLPISLCTFYILTIKIIGPHFMEKRKAFNLRVAMLIYNLIIVFTYMSALILVAKHYSKINFNSWCGDYNFPNRNAIKVLSYCWIIYMLKYVEFLDTIFFVLRKKYKLITNLHVIHHFVVPLMGWLLLRTEKNIIIHIFPIVINSSIHVIMYSYYALAAMGPNVQKYLWWKKYITILQMVQFVVTVPYLITFPHLTQCPNRNPIYYFEVFLGIMFFSLFYNYYTQSYLKAKGNKCTK